MSARQGSQSSVSKHELRVAALLGVSAEPRALDRNAGTLLEGRVEPVGGGVGGLLDRVWGVELLDGVEVGGAGGWSGGGGVELVDGVEGARNTAAPCYGVWGGGRAAGL